MSFLYGLPLFVFVMVIFSMSLSVCSREFEKLPVSPEISNVPDWSKDVVWYQIFPERFSNGNPANDPQPLDLEGSWPHSVAQGWRPSDWMGDWYELQPWEKPSQGRGFYHHVQQRRYGGDLEGVIQKLDYLSDLGITAIYLNPIFEAPSLHKYDATMYHHVDNNFGPDPEGDRKIWEMEDPGDPSTWRWTSADSTFLALIREAHRRSIKVVIDGVFNHTGITFWAFRDLQKNQQKSRYRDWYTVTAWDDPATPESEFEYEGWNGVRELPELREDDQGLVDGPSDHVQAVVRRWMDPDGDGDPADGIDGWRLDVAEMVAVPFWKKFRTWVRAINPQAYLVGEVWWEDWKRGIMFNAAPWLQGDVFDAVMNYRFAREAYRFFAGDETKISAEEFLARLESLRNDYREQNTYALMNLLDSHDTDRLASHIVNRDLPFDKQVGASDNRSYDVRKPTTAERQTQKLMALFQLTYVGAPMIYYGTEAGMWGGDDPDCRKPMLWSEFTYAPERSHPYGLTRPFDENVVDQDLLEHYRTLIRLRTSSPALQRGTFTVLATRGSGEAIAFHRAAGDDEALVVLNSSPERSSVELDLKSAGLAPDWRIAFGSAELSAVESGLRISLGERQGVVLVRGRS